MCQGGDSGARVRIKAGYFAGREGTLVHGEGGNDPAIMLVQFATGIPFRAFLNLADLEFLPPPRLHPREPEPEEPARDVTAILAGIGRWQQQDPMKRRVHMTAEPVEDALDRVLAKLRGMVDDLEKRARAAGADGLHHLADERWVKASNFREAIRIITKTAGPRPTTNTSLQGHVVTVHVVEGTTEPRPITFHRPCTEEEVVEALDLLLADPEAAHARVTTPDAEALAIHADRTPAYYGPAEGIS